MPKVSIIMATYNGERFLEKQLDSILEQDMPDFELIIGDDASSDSTKKIIEDYAARDNRIRLVFHKENIGVNANFAYCMKLINGDFVAISDQDDVWKKNKLSFQLALFKEPETVLVHSASIRFTDKIPFEKNESSAVLMEGNNPIKIILRNSISGHNILFRKSLLENVLPIPENIYYDWWMAVVATCTGKIKATQKVLAFQRKHDKNITLINKQTKKQTQAEWEERVNALIAFSKIEMMPEQYKRIIKLLLEKYLYLTNKRFSFSLMLFLFKHRKQLFYYKKGFKAVGYIKTAYRMSCKVA